MQQVCIRYFISKKQDQLISSNPTSDEFCKFQDRLGHNEKWITLYARCVSNVTGVKASPTRLIVLLNNRNALHLLYAASCYSTSLYVIINTVCQLTDWICNKTRKMMEFSITEFNNIYWSICPGSGKTNDFWNCRQLYKLFTDEQIFAQKIFKTTFRWSS